MEKRANLRIRGNVQMAGFWTFIKNVADSLNVNGFAENEKDGSEMVALMRSFDKKGEVMIGILGSMNETLKGVKSGWFNICLYNVHRRSQDLQQGAECRRD
jgi:acylphosphatase